MATTESKIDKKDLKGPDEFQTMGARAMQYVSEHAVPVIGGTLLVLVAIAAFFGWLHSQHERELEAAAKLFEGEKVLNPNDEASRMFGMAMPGSVSDEDRKKAIEVFEKVASEYPGTATARRANLLAGDSHLQLGNYDAALKAYEAALDGAGEEETFYARNGMAIAHEAKGSLADAAASYRKIVDDTSIAMRDVSALDLARVLHRDGKTEEAKAVLRGFAEKYPDSALKEEAEKELGRFGGGAVSAAATPAEPAPH